MHAADQDAAYLDDVRLVVEDVSCGVCGQRRRRRLYTEAYQLGNECVQLSINRCCDCRQVYVSPRLDQTSTRHVYRFDAARTISHNYCWAGRTSDQRFEPLLDRLSALVPLGRLLDVGCGSGSFLEAAHRRGQWRLTGIEPSIVVAEQARRRVPVPILPLQLEQTSFPAQHFDVIVLLGVLEHMHDPLGTMRHVHRLLKPQGVVAVYVPNFHYLRLKDAGPAAWLRHGRRSCLAPQEHLFHFTTKLLDRLLTRSGFEVLRLDVGRPFIGGNRWERWIKQAAAAAALALHRSTGIHLGGIEAIARRGGPILEGR
jgi:2-polyprenyl-3-methyl-5-hydroxy-6-metoxy-1,4-benzoquinol methylase